MLPYHIIRPIYGARISSPNLSLCGNFIAIRKSTLTLRNLLINKIIMGLQQTVTVEFDSTVTVFLRV